MANCTHRTLLAHDDIAAIGLIGHLGIYVYLLEESIIDCVEFRRRIDGSFDAP